MKPASECFLCEKAFCFVSQTEYAALSLNEEASTTLPSKTLLIHSKKIADQFVNPTFRTAHVFTVLRLFIIMAGYKTITHSTSTLIYDNISEIFAWIARRNIYETRGFAKAMLMMSNLRMMLLMGRGAKRDKIGSCRGEIEREKKKKNRFGR